MIIDILFFSIAFRDLEKRKWQLFNTSRDYSRSYLEKFYFKLHLGISD